MPPLSPRTIAIVRRENQGAAQKNQRAALPHQAARATGGLVGLNGLRVTSFGRAMPAPPALESAPSRRPPNRSRRQGATAKTRGKTSVARVLREGEEKDCRHRKTVTEKEKTMSWDQKAAEDNIYFCRSSAQRGRALPIRGMRGRPERPNGREPHSLEYTEPIA